MNVNEVETMRMYKMALRLACEDIKDSKRFCPKYYHMWDCGNMKCPNASNEWRCWLRAYISMAQKEINYTPRKYRP